MRRRSYRCPNCGGGFMSSRSLVRHLLEEAGPRGVTTGEFINAGVGSRYGGRIYELRHDDGLDIDEHRESESSHRYTLRPLVRTQPDVRLRCGYGGHEWDGHARRSAQGYPLLDGAGPVCPLCGRSPCAVEGAITPARPDVRERAAA